MLIKQMRAHLTVICLNCSPCNNVRGEAHHKGADECADLLGGPQPPPPLLIQAFLTHTVKVHTGAIICPGGRMGRVTRIMKRSAHKPPGAIRDRVCVLTRLPRWKHRLRVRVHFKDGVMDRTDNKRLKSHTEHARSVPPNLV